MGSVAQNAQRTTHTAKHIIAFALITAMVIMAGCNNKDNNLSAKAIPNKTITPENKTAIAINKSQPALMIRIANHSEVEFQSVLVQFETQKENYGNIGPGENSAYRNIKEAYSCAYIHTIINGKEAVIQPQDYEGDTLLPAGRYTYVLKYKPQGTDKFSMLSLELVKD